MAKHLQLRSFFWFSFVVFRENVLAVFPGKHRQDIFILGGERSSLKLLSKSSLRRLAASQNC